MKFRRKFVLIIRKLWYNSKNILKKLVKNFEKSGIENMQKQPKIINPNFGSLKE